MPSGLALFVCIAFARRPEPARWSRSSDLDPRTGANSGNSQVEAEGLPLSFLDLGDELYGISLTAEGGLESAQFGVECLHVNPRSASGFAVWNGSGHLPHVTDADPRGGRTSRCLRALTDER